VSSLDPDKVKAKDLLRLIRGHWQVENYLHCMKDCWWNEDKHTLRSGNLGDVFTYLTSLAISVLYQVKKPEKALTDTAADVHDSPKKLMRKLGFV
jgi:predicted transposase YbfD/YdcC